MDERGPAATCVFCGQPFEPGQEKVGRGGSVAHAACADRALADDEHWDRIADQVGAEADEHADERSAEPARTAAAKSGCLALAVPALTMALALGTLLGALS